MMQKRTRYFLLGAAAVLVAGLCVGLVAYVGAGAPALQPQQATGPDELALLPADAAVVAYADVQAVMASTFRQRLFEALPQEHRAPDRLREATGVDIERDVDYVLAGFVPDGAGERDGSPLVLVKGRFDAVRIEAAAVAHGATVEEYAGTRLVRFDEPRREHGTLAFLAPGLIALGDDVLIRQAIDRRAGGASITSDAVVMQLIGDLEPGSSAWAVGRLDDMTLDPDQLSPELAERIPAIEWFTASTRVNGGLSGQLRAEARDEQAAQDLRQVAQGFLALARLQTNESPAVRPLLDAVQFGGTGRTVALTFDLPIELIDGLEELLRNRDQTPAGP